MWLQCNALCFRLKKRKKGEGKETRDLEACEAQAKPSQMDASRTVKKNMIYDKRMRLSSPCLAIA